MVRTNMIDYGGNRVGACIQINGGRWNTMKWQIVLFAVGAGIFAFTENYWVAGLCLLAAIVKTIRYRLDKNINE
jgi:hypothetical protein